MCLLKTVIQRFLWGLIPSPEPGHCLSACLCVTGISVCMCVFVHECWRKSKALFPMRVIIPGWGGGWSRAGLPLHQRVFSSNTVVQAHGWPGLFLHVCAPERERERESHGNRRAIFQMFSIIPLYQFGGTLLKYFGSLSLWQLHDSQTAMPTMRADTVNLH